MYAPPPGWIPRHPNRTLISVSTTSNHTYVWSPILICSFPWPNCYGILSSSGTSGSRYIFALIPAMHDVGDDPHQDIGHWRESHCSSPAMYHEWGCVLVGGKGLSFGWTERAWLGGYTTCLLLCIILFMIIIAFFSIHLCGEYNNASNGRVKS